jgi:uncharacterized membrane protein YhhN
MMNMLIVLGAAVLLGGLLYWEKGESRNGLLINKSVLSILFVIAAVVQPHPLQGFYYYLLAGLILCLAGDVLLALPQEKAFTLGLFAFLLGHVVYIGAFLELVGVKELFSILPFVFVASSILVFLWLRPHLGRMTLPVVLYILAITVMGMAACAVYLKPALGASGRIAILIGAVCFYISDVFVARERFVKGAYLNRLLGLPLYYGGQFLLAFSVGMLG